MAIGTWALMSLDQGGYKGSRSPMRFSGLAGVLLSGGLACPILGQVNLLLDAFVHGRFCGMAADHVLLRMFFRWTRRGAPDTAGRHRGHPAGQAGSPGSRT